MDEDFRPENYSNMRILNTYTIIMIITIGLVRVS